MDIFKAENFPFVIYGDYESLNYSRDDMGAIEMLNRGVARNMDHFIEIAVKTFMNTSVVSSTFEWIKRNKKGESINSEDLVNDEDVQKFYDFWIIFEVFINGHWINILHIGDIIDKVCLKCIDFMNTDKFWLNRTLDEDTEYKKTIISLSKYMNKIKSIARNDKSLEDSLSIEPEVEPDPLNI